VTRFRTNEVAEASFNTATVEDLSRVPEHGRAELVSGREEWI